jgi:glucose/arabinose dehydrogenase
VFVAGFGDEKNPKVTGGVYAIKGGKPVKLAGSPPHVFGLAYKGGTLYVSAGRKILAWSGWDGTKFAKSRVVVKAPKGFTSFNGVAVGPDGKIYTGVSLGDKKSDDYKHGSTPYANDVLTVDTNTGAITVVAKGLRQPWQLAFVPGHSGPLVSDLGQENLGKKRPPDRIVEIKAGADYGFPSCPAKPASCANYTKPFAQFPAHSSPMGIGALGGKIYIALFGGTGKGPEVVSMGSSGGKFGPFLTGFVAPVVAVGVNAGKVYAGDLTGSIYSSNP